MKYIRLVLDALTSRVLTFVAGYWCAAHPEENPRYWSNRELAKYGVIFNGNVVNVSGGKDSDKQGKTYQSYFPHARSYSITNYKQLYMTGSNVEEILLDLSVPNAVVEAQYDVVFNHTVLEHVFDIDTALDNICCLSRDVVISVVPFLQSMHMQKGVFQDYWRFTPVAMDRLLSNRGFHTIHCDYNRFHPLSYVYVIHIASKYPDRYNGCFPRLCLPETSDNAPGCSLNHLLDDTNLNQKWWLWQIGKWIGRQVKPRHSI